MRVLLDEDLPHRLRIEIPNHDVWTTVYAGLGGLANGALLRAAEQHAFDVFVTADRGLPDQQNMKGRRLAVVVLSTLDWKIMQPHVDRIVAAIDAARPGSLQHVNCGRFSRKPDPENS